MQGDIAYQNDCWTYCTLSFLEDFLLNQIELCEILTTKLNIAIMEFLVSDYACEPWGMCYISQSNQTGRHAVVDTEVNFRTFALINHNISSSSFWIQVHLIWVYFYCLPNIWDK